MKRVQIKIDKNNPKIRAYKNAVDAGRKSYHVFLRSGEWVVKHAGSSRASQTFQTQTEAKKYAIGVSQNQGTALFIHGRDGRIRERNDW